MLDRCSALKAENWNPYCVPSRRVTFAGMTSFPDADNGISSDTDSPTTSSCATKAPKPLSLRSRAQPCRVNLWLPRHRRLRFAIRTHSESRCDYPKSLNYSALALSAQRNPSPFPRHLGPTRELVNVPVRLRPEDYRMGIVQSRRDPRHGVLICQVNERFLLPHDLLHSINGLLPFFMSNVEACVRMSASISASQAVAGVFWLGFHW